MVYKIRNKSFFWTRAGWRNNWHPKNFNSPRPSNTDTTIGIRCRYDHNSFLRAYHSYRKISRHCKQYFYGSKELEELFQMTLRNIYLIPLYSICPTDELKHGGERRFADQVDRDFELISYNTHPYQLFAYEIQNKDLALQQQAYEDRKTTGKSFEDEMIEYISSQADLERAKLRPGERLSIERATEIALDAMRKVKSQQKYQDSRFILENNILQKRKPDGEFNDFMEQRRPFVAPSTNTHTH